MIRNTHKILIQTLSLHDLHDQDGKVVNNEHEYKNVPDRSKLKVQNLLKNGTIFCLLIIICRLDNLSAHIKKTHGVTWQVEPIALTGICFGLYIFGAFLSFGN